ncbi:hypothetical protein BN1049_02814 [Pseudomonas saudimassiliensis]|uniref:Iron-containing redox enzyme family protein n=1 Tax=Pseudomonas saudimassiliensis TaxID=1461581 RepID=A0A078MNM8_9PSED|nr:iron-containing redox enzyme family protein [Pseudomonas saudimassiliensis]CEA06426.1 hypothetical protein BN1049_02814 [Pseudomonas saudimassiliensis]CEF27851.1 hypothetical protein BN1049_02814 [Pseudomonas saudimassiliensis]
MPTLKTPTRQTLPTPSSQRINPRTLYHGLLQSPSEHLGAARDYLQENLRRAAALPCDLPEDPSQLSQWVHDSSGKVADAYNAYLAARKQGQPRRFFTNRAHALYFLRGVAPTKLVDGAWLYGIVSQWQDWRFHGLVRTYLEELGDGEPTQNHVALYKQLLYTYDLNDTDNLSPDHYIQGALQLALAHQARDFLPELIGYNLGYEQLPLHLLISIRELSELGIDPYYFQLHVTIDNADTGHAQKAVDAVLNNLPTNGDTDAFLQRVRAGYLLNELGTSSMDVIEGFRLEHEVQSMLEHKAVVARNIHSDRCRIEGRTVNEWLATPGQMGAMLAALEKRGWIRRHTDPEESRFWQLVHGNRAPMFGVFSGYELQLLHDWIAGEWAAPTSPRRPQPAPPMATTDDFAEEQSLLRQQLNALPAEEQMAALIELMGPATHYTPAGLLATRLFTRGMGHPSGF